VGKLPSGITESQLIEALHQVNKNEQLIFAGVATVESPKTKEIESILILTNLRILLLNTESREWDSVAVFPLMNDHLKIKDNFLFIWHRQEHWLGCSVSSDDELPMNNAVRSLREIEGKFIEMQNIQVSANTKSRKMRMAEERQALHVKTGAQIASATFPSAWLATVVIYQKGFVTVKGSTEKLVAISASDNTTTKSALGRGLGAVATAGINMHGSKLRGQAYLIVTTESKSVSIHLESPTPKEIQDLHRIVAAGQNVIESNKSVTPPSQGVAVQSDVASQLKQLSDLHAAGALTDSEFAEAKSRILG